MQNLFIGQKAEIKPTLEEAGMRIMDIYGGYVGKWLPGFGDLGLHIDELKSAGVFGKGWL